VDTHPGLAGYIRAHPNDKQAVKVYAEFIEEHTITSHFAALRTAAKVRRDVINEREIADALALIDDDCPARENLYRAIVAWSNNPGIRISYLFVVAGSRPPFAQSRYCSNPGAWWYEWDVTVGARWLLREALDIQLDLNHLAGAIASHHAGS
jgi:hypothetical protein